MASSLTSRLTTVSLVRDAGRPAAKSPTVAWMPPLDGLRGLAILLVMLFHYSMALNARSLPQHAVMFVAQLGWSGVDLFFVLSGFLITGILLDSRDAENYFSSFYARRVLRIFPVYYLSLFVVFFVFPKLMAGYDRVSPLPSERIWYFAYAQNWIGWLVSGERQRLIGHYWSLAIEEQFYLIWPCVVYLVARKRLLQIATWGALASILLRFGLLAMSADSEVIYRNTFCRMDALLLGAACACLLRDPSWVRRLRPYAAWLWIAPLVALEGVREATRFFDPTPQPQGLGLNHAPGVQGLGFTVIALGYAALLLGVVLTMGSGSLLQRIFCSRLLRTFGKYSYAAYIWHIAARSLVDALEAKLFRSPLPGPINVLLMIGVTLLISMASYALLEGPLLKLKRYFAPRFSARVAHGQAVTV